ncbi:ROK family protein [Asticcacaulis sp. ZE23SCel15]|uniref:ROK family protein n=1 Tax=Asticcacaulis sp. ZE23SCel15 TaxID=3059027 RepID=UPI00265EF7B4|nr:ROK family protein [Asticcacaulis sp. ZE23SCel15]WKL56721.1 ROK family protein [Asticcacaulis sp. ZE23SCel15]
MARFIGIEIGGTKVNIATGTGPEDLSPTLRIATRTPEATMADVITALKAIEGTGPIDAIGIASFGPIEVSQNRATFGHFRKTPKPGWSHFDLMGPLKSAFASTPMALDTDVNGAALGEARWGAARGLDSFAYATVGTGIGVGIISHNQPIHGLLHPEAGHVPIQRDPARDPFEGACPFHAGCLEGLASGPAIKARTGIAGEDLSPDDPVWSLVGGYLGQMFYSLALIASPQRILVGGSVGLNARVLSAARDEAFRLMNGYLEALETRAAFEAYIQPAQLGDKAGVLGALVLAARAARP